MDRELVREDLDISQIGFGGLDFCQWLLVKKNFEVL
jgi:hypothetical protein